MLGAEQRLRPLDRELLDLVDDLAAAVVALAGSPSAYLFVSTEPTASSTAGQVKFSEAISSSWSRWRRARRCRARRSRGRSRRDPRFAVAERALGDAHGDSYAGGTDVRSLSKEIGRRGSPTLPAVTRSARTSASESAPSRSTTAPARQVDHGGRPPTGVGPPSTPPRPSGGSPSAPRRASSDRARPAGSPTLRRSHRSGRSPRDRRRQHRHAQADPRGSGPHSQRNRRPGFGTTTVTGPGSSRRARTPARPSSSGRTVANTVSSEAAMTLVGFVRSRSLMRSVRSHASGRCAAHASPYTVSVGRTVARPAASAATNGIEIVLERQAQRRHSARKRASPRAMPRAIRWRTPACSSRAASAGLRMLAVSSSTFGTCDQSRPP